MKPSALFLMDLRHLDDVYGPDVRAEIGARTRLLAPPLSPAHLEANRALLNEVELLFCSWGAPVFDAAFLNDAPQLKAVFYGAGTIKHLVTDAFWRRGIIITTARAANAVPVSEYTLAVILFSLKHGWHAVLQTRREGRPPTLRNMPGAWQSTVGLVSMGAVGRLVRERLRPFALRVMVYDPFLTAEQAAAQDVTPATLEQLFRESDVVSLHAPNLPSTRGLITGALLASMKPGASFINTARGAVVRESELIAVARQRPDLQFVLDVTDPEPPVDESPLYRLPNVVYTPHIAGSQGRECRRMGQLMLEELDRYLSGRPLAWAVTREEESRMA